MNKLFLILIVMLLGITNCKKDGNATYDKGINFSALNENADNIVSYNEIVGYDSIKYVFRINETAWQRLMDRITPIYPDPNFGFVLRIDNQSIYTAHFIPGYYSMINNRLITFFLSEPDLVYMTLGYPPLPVEEFEGKDLRNDSSIINRLKKDNKLIEIGK